jgi:RNA ligase
MELQIQKYLRNRTQLTRSSVSPLEALEAEFSIKAKRHGKYSNLVLLKFSQIDSPFQLKIVRECRGIILDESDNWNVVCYTYSKFFNVQETLAAPIDWSNASVQEKLDGSIIQLYHYRGEWLVATSGTPDAQTPIGDYGMTFYDMFWRVFRMPPPELALDKKYCYAFELCCPENRVVVQHKESRLVLHGIRDLVTMQEIDPLDTEWEGCFETPKTFPITSIDECLEAAKHLDPLSQEGYVVCDSNFNRVKVKSPAYLALHHAKDGLLSQKKMALIIRTGESSEFEQALVAFPELKPHFDRLVTRYNDIVFQANTAFTRIKHIENQKEFALAAKLEYYPGVLFGMRKGLTPQSYLLKLTEPAYLRMIGVKENE